LRARNYAKSNNLDNINFYISEATVAGNIKEKFDKSLLEEINKFSENYAKTLTNLINEFKETIIELNSKVC
jgi:hypothetical protein